MIANFILLLGIWMATDMTLAQGWLYALLKPLPILRSLHANVRFTAAFIFPLAILGSLIFNMLFKDPKGGNVIAFSLSAIFTLAMLSLYLALPLDMHVRNFNLKSALPLYARIDNGWNFTLQNVAEITDMEVFHQEDSNLGSQDPMFGYEGEFFHPKAVVGPIMELHNGTYYMTNPASYVFPEENDLQPFDLFRKDQGAQLERFINHQQPRLKLSSWQIFADLVSFATLVGLSFIPDLCFDPGRPACMSP